VAKSIVVVVAIALAAGMAELGYYYDHAPHPTTVGSTVRR